MGGRSNGALIPYLFLIDRENSSLGLRHFEHNPVALPWVEAAEGVGVGEWVQLDMPEPASEVYVLNGFVDIIRPHLYKQNSRIKDALAIGTTPDGREMILEVLFQDFAYFKTIAFPEPVVSVRLVIRSAYPGSRWQDTAVSGFLPPPVYREIYMELRK